MIPSFLTQYYEEERGPFKNICDLSEQELDVLIFQEKEAATGFNRFSFGKEFFKIRRAADDLVIEKYREKFGFAPKTRPFYAVLGNFDRTMQMYRNGKSVRIDVCMLSREQLTFIYPDHFALVWSSGAYPPFPGLFPPPSTYSYQPFHDLLFTYDELPAALHHYEIEARIARAKELKMWVSSYIEAHIWDPEIRDKCLALK